jgi:putative DNA primase/helicase
MNSRTLINYTSSTPIGLREAPTVCRPQSPLSTSPLSTSPYQTIRSLSSNQTIRSLSPNQKNRQPTYTDRNLTSSIDLEDQIDKIIYATRYIEKNFVPFSVGIEINIGGKKRLKNVPKFCKITDINYKHYIAEYMNGMAIRMGGQMDNDYHVVLIDIDNKQSEFVANGKTKWEEMTTNMQIITPIQKTANNGLHYLFKVQNTDFEKLPSAITELEIDGKKFSIDFKGKNQFMLVEPSSYYVKDIKKEYKWIYDIHTEVKEMPKWLYNILIKHGEKQKHPELQFVKNQQVSSYVENLLDNRLDYVPLLKKSLEQGMAHIDTKRNNNYTSWRNLGMLLIKFGDFGLELWKDFSKNYSNYNEAEIMYKAQKFDTNEGIGYGSFMYWLSQDDPKYYKQFLSDYKDLLDMMKMNSIDVEAKELERLYDLGDCGYVQIYHMKFKDELICTSQDGNMFYLYNYKTELWEEKTQKDIQKHFMENMKIIIQTLIDYYKKMSEFAKQKSVDEEKIVDKKKISVKYTPEFYKASKSKHLMPMIASDFYNKDFMKLLNNEKDMLSVKGGLINLKTGEMRKRTKADYCSFQLDVDYKGIDHPTPLIDDFISNLMLGHKDMVDYVQKLLGYSITGYINEQKFVILWGSGGNGKGVLMNVLKNLLKDYYKQVTSDVVIQGKKGCAGSASPHLMQLFGARLAFVDESELGGKVNEAVIKNITGGGAITARPLYGNPITFEPSFQLFLLTNHKPEINTSPSLKRRVILIPFLAEFKDKTNFDPVNERHRCSDINIENKINARLDELLVWLVKGSTEYFKNGLLDIPPTIELATNDYIKENDELENLIEDCCEKSKIGYVYHADLYGKYLSTTNKKISQRVFTTMMAEKGYTTKRKNDGIVFLGLSFKKQELENLEIEPDILDM